MNRRRTALSDAPLLAWGDTLRARKRRRRRLRRTGLVLASGIAALGLTIIAPPAPRLVWNATASAPIGLYWVRPGRGIARGTMVLAHLPEGWRDFAARRRYLPANVPLVKRVAAGPGDEICAANRVILLDGRPLATRRDIDGAGRPMPHWRGCRRLKGGEFFLLMTASPASFDGRYFGVTKADDIVGPARLLWAL